MLELSPTLIVSGSEDLATPLAEARNGDPEAFGDLCRALEARLLRQAILLCGEVSLAEDLVQDTLIEAWKSLHRYNGACRFFTWLCAILQNRYRNTTRRKRLLLFFGFGPAGFDQGAELVDGAVDNPWPDLAAQSREQAALVRRCVRALPIKHQEVIYLRFFVDDSLEGIAAALHCSVGTVKSRLFHGLEKLRGMPALRQQCDLLPP